MTQNSEILQSIYAAAARGDIPGFLDLLHPQIDWTEAEGFMTEGKFIGPDAVVQGVFGPLFAEFPNFFVNLQEVIDGGERLVALGRYSGTHASTEKSFEAAFAHVWTITGGKATTFRQYVDNAPVEAARSS